jgi:hypothetical protein
MAPAIWNGFIADLLGSLPWPVNRRGDGRRYGCLTGFVRSKDDAVEPKISSNQKYDDHYANDGKNVHFAVPSLRADARGVLACLMYPLAIKLMASFRRS